MQVNVCHSPALYPFYDTTNAIVVVVDVFRATTSICAAFHNGAIAVRTVSTLEEAISYKNKGFLVAAERNVKKCDFADFGNSPFDFAPAKVAGKDIVFTTTNGTRAVEMALNADEIVIGAFSNLSLLTRYCTRKEKNVLIVCSGWNNRLCMEDTLFAGALTEKLTKSGKFEGKSDAVMVARELWRIAKPELNAYVRQTEHYERLRQNGLEDAAEYCFTEDLAPVLPVYRKSENRFTV